MVGAPSTYGFQVNFQDKIEIEKTNEPFLI